MTDNYTAPQTFTTGEVVTAAKLNVNVRDNMEAVKLGLVGDASADTDIKHAHKSGTLASRPAASQAGRFYYATDLGVLFFDTGTRWDVLSVNHRIASHTFEDFSRFNSAGGAGGSIPEALGWTPKEVANTGAWGMNTNRDRITFNTGGTINSVFALYDKFQNGNYLLSSRTPALYSCQASTPQTTQTLSLLGLQELSATGFSPNGVYFKRTDAAGVGNWFAVCRAGGVGAGVDTTIAGDTAEHFFEIVIYSTSLVRFYIDGVQRGGDFTTTIPTTSQHLKFYVSNTEAVSKSLYVDMVEMICKR